MNTIAVELGIIVLVDSLLRHTPDEFQTKEGFEQMRLFLLKEHAEKSYTEVYVSVISNRDDLLHEFYGHYGKYLSEKRD